MWTKEDIIVKLSNNLQNITVYGKRHGTIEYDVTAARDNSCTENHEIPQPTVLYMWYGNLSRPINPNNVQVKFMENIGIMIDLKGKAERNGGDQSLKINRGPNSKLRHNA